MSGTADFLEFAVWLSAVGGEKKVVANTSFVSARSMPGARLEISPSGVITIIDDHSGVGAAEAIYEWTVAFADRSFVLAGYEYEFYDQLIERKRGHCALNLLDGSGRVNGTNVSFAPIVKDINMITVDFQPRLCKFKFNDL